MPWLWAALLLVILIALYCVLIARTHHKYRGIPGPPRSSFIGGNLGEFIEAKKKGTVSSELFLEWHIKYGYTIVVFVFHKAIVISCDPEIIKDMLLQNPKIFPKASLYDSLGFILGDRGLGNGLLTERDYDKWWKQRQIVNPAFHKRYLAEMVKDFNVIADEFIHVLRSTSAGGEPVELTAPIHDLTMDIMTKAVFGVQAGALRGDRKLPNAFRGIIAGMHASVDSASPNWSPFMYSVRKHYQQSLGVVKSVARRSVSERLMLLKNGETQPDDILSAMVSAHAEDPEFTIDLVMDNMLTLFLAGQETTANALSFVFMELGRHPEVLARVTEEIERCVGNKRFISFDDISALQYSGMVIKEALRMYPVAIGTSRLVPLTRTYKDVCIPGGTDIMFSIYASHRHPKLVSQADRFDPDRFSTDNANSLVGVSYLPFSLGPRACAGPKLAVIEMKLIIAKLVQQFKFALIPSQSFAVAQVTSLQPLHGVTVTLTKH